MKLNKQQEQQRDMCQALIDDIFDGYGVVTVVTEREGRMFREFGINGEGYKWMVDSGLTVSESK